MEEVYYITLFCLSLYSGFNGFIISYYWYKGYLEGKRKRFIKKDRIIMASEPKLR